jgi:hypothetical protein
MIFLCGQFLNLALKLQCHAAIPIPKHNDYAQVFNITVVYSPEEV